MEIKSQLSPLQQTSLDSVKQSIGSNQNQSTQLEM